MVAVSILIARDCLHKHRTVFMQSVCSSKPVYNSKSSSISIHNYRYSEYAFYTLFLASSTICTCSTITVKRKEFFFKPVIVSS